MKVENEKWDFGILENHKDAGLILFIYIRVGKHSHEPHLVSLVLYDQWAKNGFYIFKGLLKRKKMEEEEKDRGDKRGQKGGGD